MAYHQERPEISNDPLQPSTPQHKRPEDILDNVSFFSGENKIKIDSIDVIELVVSIQKKFNVKIDDQNLAKDVINTVNSISEFVYAQHHKS